MRKYHLGGFAEPNFHEVWAELESGVPLLLPQRFDTAQPENDGEEGNPFLNPRVRSHYDWQVHYHFTGDVRQHIFGKGRRYGSPYMTYRRLFMILIGLNGGVNFIDTYIETILPYTDVGADLDDWLTDAEESVAEMYESLRKTKRGGVDRRFTRAITAYNNYREFVNEDVATKSKALSKRIKDDIVMRAMSGELPLTTQFLSEKTQEKRMQAGLKPTPRYYASGQFIRNLKITMRFERKGNWLSDTLTV